MPKHFEQSSAFRKFRTWRERRTEFLIFGSREDKLVQTERKISHLVFRYIAAIDDRKLYLDRAFPNLFAFLTTACGYSDGAASRRIKAARALREIPEIGQKLEEGTLNLS